ncbi:MAG: cell division protein FtsH, partial [Candidatus Brocadiaceae bacterium]|jgi:cell division protease FtsH
VAHHESGHALVACLVPGADPVRKVSMIPRGSAALGYTMQMPTEDRYVLRRGELMDRMAVMLGGRAAEEVVFGEVSTGANNDLQKATDLAREMVTRFGMCEEIGPLSYASRDRSSGVSPEIQFGKPWSERTARQIDEAVRKLVDEAHDHASELLAAHKDALLALASALRDKEAIEQDELRGLLAEHSIELPPPEKARGTGEEQPEPGEAPETESAEVPGE